MDKFKISIGMDGLPCSIRFNGRDSIDVGMEGPVEISESKIRPLLLLALFTEWKRSQDRGTRKKTNPRCPSLKPIHAEAARTLSQALCDRRNYDGKNVRDESASGGQRARVKLPDGGPDATPEPKQSPADHFAENPMRRKGHWLKYIFGEWPLERYLIANKHSGDVAFTKNVQIVIEDVWDSILEDDPNEKEKLYRSYAEGERQSELKISIELNLEKNGECLSTIIDTNTCAGSFRTNAEFWIKAVANFETQFHVFWVFPDTSRVMFPSVDFPDIGRLHRAGDNFELRIGESRNIVLRPPAGTQTCILLLNGKAIAVETCKVILGLIEECIPAESRRSCVSKPALTKHRLGEGTRAFEVMPELPQILWQDILAQRLRGYGEILYVFSVPHR